jgi:UDP-2,3-diacylglucosamine hydrolase
MSLPAPTKASRVVGILAGGGGLPREVAERLVAHGIGVHIVALAGEAGDDLSAFPLTRVGWGQIGAMVRALKNSGCRQLVIVGSVTRPDLSALRPDMGFVRHLPAIVRIIRSGGDDGVLTRVVRFFEDQGFQVVGTGDVVPELVVREGPVGSIAASTETAGDVAFGFNVIRMLGPFDVGQAVVVADGRLEAIEGAEGTDAMLRRVALQRQRGAGTAADRSGVLVKRPKPGQELRIDMPAIGPHTVEVARGARLAGVAVLAGGTLAAERDQLAADADAGGLFVQGFGDRTGQVWPHAQAQWRYVRLNNRSPSTQESIDAGKGADLITALGQFARSRGVVVDHNHVLAVECGEGIPALLQRMGGLRQWGRRRWRRASGVAVLRDVADLETAIADAAAAGLAGIVVMEMPLPVSAPVEPGAMVAKDAERLKLFLAALTPAEEEP